MRSSLLSVAAVCAVGLATGLTTGLSAAVAAPAQAADDFFTYSGSTPLAELAPGAVLRTRTLSYHLAGIRTPVRAVQVLYRSTDARGRPLANVTSVLVPPKPRRDARAVSYQSFYDSLSVADSPSRAIAGDVTFGGQINTVEAVFIAPALLDGYPVVVPDTEGPTADFAAGPEYGMNTLDSLRAAIRVKETGLNSGTRFGLYGYSGGAIATNWAAQLAPSYAPEIDRQLAGAASGGVLVNPARNLRYVEGAPVWGGVIAMALTGVGRSYGIDLDPYLSDRGRAVLAKTEHASIAEALATNSGLTWKELVKPQYADPNSIPAFVDAVNRINMGLAPSPTVPVLMGQGAGGGLEGTPGDKPGIGPGDGVMVAGDVRSLARKYCDSGIAVRYVQYDALSHTLAAPAWLAEALPWLADRLAGRAAPSDCGRIPPGNPLTAQTPSATRIPSAARTLVP